MIYSHHSADRLSSVYGQHMTDTLRGAAVAARKCHPTGIGWQPKPRLVMTPAEKVAIYRRKIAAGAMSAETIANLIRNFPELEGAQ
jgi:hypothetical protein